MRQGATLCLVLDSTRNQERRMVNQQEAENTFPELNISALKVVVLSWAKDIPGLQKVTLFHGRTGEAGFQLVFHVDRTYTGPVDSLIPLSSNLRGVYRSKKAYSDSDWGLCVETGNALPTEFILEEYSCILFERTKGASPVKRLLFGGDLRDRWGVNDLTLVDYILSYGLPAYNPATMQPIDIPLEKGCLMKESSWQKNSLQTVREQISHLAFSQDDVSAFETHHQLPIMTGQISRSSPDSNVQEDSARPRRADERPSPPTSEERLNGKKSIAKFLNVSEDTVDKYRGEGMPIFSLNKRIFAYPHEVNEWLQKTSKKKGKRK